MGVKKQSREPMSLEEFLHHLFVGSGSFYIGGRDGGLYSYELSDGKLTLSYEPDPDSARCPATYTFTLDDLPPFRSEDSMLTKIEHDEKLIEALAEMVFESFAFRSVPEYHTDWPRDAAEAVLDHLVSIGWRAPSRGIQIGSGNVQVNTF